MIDETIPTVLAEPQADVVLSETDDLRYVLSETTIPSGPQVWKITNTGEHHSHHAVIFRIQDEVTADQIISEFGPMMQGTPPAEDSSVSQMTWVGYAALQSGGRTTWVGLDFEPADYAVICYILDPETGAPHLLNGMVTTFTVQ